MRANYERIRADVGGSVTIVAATKYVSLADMAVLVDPSRNTRELLLDRAREELR